MSYIMPTRISPFYQVQRIPRKLKKRVKAHCGASWPLLNNNQRLWYYLDHAHLNYKQAIIFNI